MSSILFFVIHIITNSFAFASDENPNINDFVYYNYGKTTNKQEYILAEITNVYNEGYQYKNNYLGSNNWHDGTTLTYLYERYSNGTIGTPSNGLRSAVPLGAFGQGVFELRGDGRFTDFTIFNNGPNALPSNFSHKWDLNEMLFGFTFNTPSGISSKILQPSPYDENMEAYSIESLSYYGSYPVSKLTAIDKEWQSIGIKSVNLTAFSSFEPHNINTSSVPGVVFWFDIDNTDNINDIEMDFFFNLPDIINFDNVSVNNKQNGFIMNKILNKSDPNYFISGNMSFTIQSCNITSNNCNKTIKGNKYSANELYDNWKTFLNSNSNKFNSLKPKETQLNGPVLPVIHSHYAWISDNITIKSNSIYSFAVILSWYYPYRTWNTNRQYLGNYYNNLYNSSQNVNDYILNNLSSIISSIVSWHNLFNQSMNALYPDYLNDLFINSASFISRTGYLLENSKWYQLESFSCAQMDPPDIYGYRALSFNLLFDTQLNRNILDMYTYGQVNDGIISEDWGGGCATPDGCKCTPNPITCIECIIGTPNYQQRGDDNSIYVLNMYSQLKWYKDGKQYVSDRYEYIKSAMNWIKSQSMSSGYGLPYRMQNTFNFNQIMGDINTYSSMLYISALHAMKLMSLLFESDNIIYHIELDNALDSAQYNLTNLLYNNDHDSGSGFFRSYWCQNGTYSHYALQSDVLYGYLWSIILDLDKYWKIDKMYIISHIQQEEIRNLSPYGLQFITHRKTVGYNCGNKKYSSSYKDRDTWEMATFNHATLSLYLLIGNVDYALSFSKIIINKYNNIYNDQWDYRDVSSTYNDTDPTYSRPVSNSHYSRQLIYYSLIWALNGIQLNVDSITNKLFLQIKPLISMKNNNDCIPILIPQFTFLLCLNLNKQCFQLKGLFSNLKLFIINELSITNAEIQYNFTNVNITKGQTTTLPVKLRINP